MVDVKVNMSPTTSQVIISYLVPSKVHDVIDVRCEFKPDDENIWQPCRVLPFLSESGLRLLNSEEWLMGVNGGLVREQRAAGLERSLIWNPFPEAIRDSKVKGKLRLTLTELGKAEPMVLYEHEIDVDVSETIYLKDWSQVYQKEFISTDPGEAEARWWWKTGIEGDTAPTCGRCLAVKEKGVELPPLTYLLNLSGWYAIYVCPGVGLGAIDLSLTSDEHSVTFNTTRRYREEIFWRVANMEGENLVIRQPYHTVYQYEEDFRATLDYVKLVPLTEEKAKAMRPPEKRADDKMLICYDEPYSWAFNRKIEHNSQHYERLATYCRVNADIVDMQVARIGAKVYFPSRHEDPLIGETTGDAVRGKRPATFNVGRMYQYTRLIPSSQDFAKILPFKLFLNLGANNCYAGTPLNGRFAAEHPQWVKGWQLQFQYPEIREYALNLIREVLEYLPSGFSMDFCRYPMGFPDRQYITDYLRDIRRLVNAASAKRGSKILFLARFPAEGTNEAWVNFDYETYAQEQILDILVPSAIWSYPYWFDVSKYVKAAEGTGCLVCPSLEAWFFTTPQQLYLRVADLYRQGTDGFYIYQADSFTQMGDGLMTKAIATARDPALLKAALDRDSTEQPHYSKRILFSHCGGLPDWQALTVWPEGFLTDRVEFYLDDELVNVAVKPPYILFGDQPLYQRRRFPEGKHRVRVRARDGDGWIVEEAVLEKSR